MLRRAFEELRVTETLPLVRVGSFKYRSHLDNQLIEHEFDHVFVALVKDLQTESVEDEVSELRWWSESEIMSHFHGRSDIFTAWFGQVFSLTLDYLYDDSLASRDSQKSISAM